MTSLLSVNVNSSYMYDILCMQNKKFACEIHFSVTTKDDNENLLSH